MNLERTTWLRFLSRATVLCAMIFGTVHLALARDGVSGGAPRSFLTVSGVLTGVSGTPMATFRFSHAGASGDGGAGPTVLCAPTVPITNLDPSTHTFSVEVPLDQPGQECPASLFDGSDAFVEVAIGTNTVVVRRAITPVPYATYAQQYGTPDCPVGYQRTIDPGQGFFADSPRRLCIRRRADGSPADQVVRVGVGPTAFWIDRYEAGVYRSDGEGNCDVERGFPVDGQPRSFPSCVALSRAGAVPTRSNWFQANRACAASGKRLATGAEWLLAADGTDDPTTPSTGEDGRCVTDSTGPRAAGGRSRCISTWGAEDMIGNVDEWTTEWFAGVGNFATRQRWVQSDGGVDWSHDDTVHNATGIVAGDGDMGHVAGIPAGARRGGFWGLGRQAGVFQLFLLGAPSDDGSGATGIRCVIPR